MGLLYLNRDSTYNTRAELFANNEQGLWLDPSQMSTVYQDSNGVTPCTAAGDPVGLILDQSRGGLSQIGADLVTNGTFAADSDWTKGANWTIGSGVATKTGGAANNLTQTIGSTAAAWYRISLDVTRSAGTLTVSLGTSGTTYAITSTGSYTFFILAGSGTQTLTLAGDSSFAGTVDNVGVRNVPGNHAYQTTSASRPTLARIPSSGRRNLIIYNEDLSNAAWVNNGGTVTSNSTIAPDGTTTADTLTRSTAATEGRYQAVAFTGDGAKAVSVYVKAGTAPSLGVWLFDSTATVNRMLAAVDMTGATPIVTLTAGASSVVENVGSGWFRLTFVSTSVTAANTNRLYLMPAYGGASANGQTSIFWGAMAENAASATNYQKVVATTDVTESGVSDLWHLVFDGSDDSLVTNSVDFSATDEMTVIAGVRKLSDAAFQVVAELTPNWNTSPANNGAFLHGVADSTWLYNAGARGTQTVNANQVAKTTSATYAAPVTNVFAASHDISNDSTSLRLNATDIETATGEKGSGNFANAAIYIGRRGGVSSPFNGHIYQLIVRGKTTPTGKLLEAERFVARRTGVTGI